jgi:molybdate transport system substrate-binding protein
MTHIKTWQSIVCGAVVVALAHSPRAQSRPVPSGVEGPVRVLASNGVKAVVEELVPLCEKAIGRPLSIEFNSSAMLKQGIDKGDPFDVAIVTSELMDQLIKEGRIAAATRAAVARSGIGVGVRAGARKPDIRTADAMKRTLLDARAITYAQDGASRPHIVKMLERLGIADEIGRKAILEQGSIRSAGRVVNGDADLLITLNSEILPIKGMELVGSLPAEFQSYVTLVAGAGSKAADPVAAKAVIAFLTGPGVETTLRTKGMEKP